MQDEQHEELPPSPSFETLDSLRQDNDNEAIQPPNAPSPILERRVASSDAFPPQLSSRHRCGEGSNAPSLLNLNRQLEDLSRDIQQLNARCRSDSMPNINKTPLRPQHLLPEKQLQLLKQRLPHLNSALSARGASTPSRTGRESSQRRQDALPTVSPSPPRSRCATSVTRPYQSKQETPCSSRVFPGRASERPIASPSSPSIAANMDSVTPAAVTEDPQADGKQCAIMRTRGGRIRVVVRKRPLPPDENSCDCVSMDPPNVKVAVRKQRVDLTEYADVNDFTFDDAFGEDKHNEHVFNSCCKELLETTLQGGSASCFAYGQTGSGKTHTMLGNSGERGLYILAAAAIFSSLEKDQEVYASLYEIYCNSLFDLLNNRSPVVVREDHNRRMQITGLTWHAVTSAEELQLLINSGADQRSTGSTTANERSSRSHAVLTIQVRDREDNRFCGTLNLVDLAGSERAADTATNDRQTRQEGAEINKSLLALKECIRALDEKKKHVPFRGSKLTEILRDSFIGNSRTVMIANISASSQNYEHTLNTLRYAFRVKGLSIVNFEPSRARNAPRPLKPIVPDVNPAQGVPLMSGVPSRTTPGRRRTASSNVTSHAAAGAAAPPAASHAKGYNSMVPVTTRRNVSSNNTPFNLRNNAGSPFRGGAQGNNVDSRADDEQVAEYVRRLTREKVMNILPQTKLNEAREQPSPKNDYSLQDESCSFSFNHELMKELEDRVVEEIKAELTKAIKDVLLKRDKTFLRLRREKALLMRANTELEKRMADCPHCKGQAIRPVQQQPN
ncbi:MCAK-like kinesin, putative [Trypanosoma brucei gambiense DAL972]|uniref:Kinesin-like protein n=5 Tax=Trypanozoon TaxID=39700 RepID=Q57XZ5_TRYB2|nr:MCAK-like kinesin, putative [Trypanosoma brucei gambiense DAL972]XP_844541.1 mitotic centromere-associated kinesin (MCAK), putative [Trypanosoma brucei brucei TREU927]AAX69505.1 mitotic centromere-associated kinesin (MCAK), putative [Trypanosoma brucei]RHW72909.1 Kinesin-13 4b [Trypanosoma brucei equiperdum]AAZ10982.1 mitotic centromere-associated kinesin (MCAK), putative [Trypanosoma brucei brucei TREU927]CBH10703.1 MCAK-like kinesin, putative [Trypanosoma brucei gambiense DAL972]|eukprot:XP_011772991.1 MCAK-like kinesin, putative [Trypanosoma brucei gambiense DAL972]